MNTLLMQLALACIGAGLLAGSGLLLRGLCRGDHVLRYRILRVHLVSMLGLIMVQGLAVSQDWTPRIEWVSAAIGATDSRPSRSAGTSCTDMPESAVLDLARRTDDQFGLGSAAGVSEHRRAAIWIPDFWNLVAVCYALIAALLGIRGILRGAATWRVMRRATPVTDERALEIWNRVQPVGGAGQRARLLECAGLASPACWGLRRPAVLLPEGFAARHAADTLGCVLRHELVHLARADHTVAMAAHTLAAALWPQPLVRCFARAVDEEREASCDAMVVRMTGHAKLYATALLACCQSSGVTAAVSMNGGSGIQRRIMMLTESHVRAGRIRARVVAAATASALLAIFSAQVVLAGVTASVETKPGPERKVVIEMHAPGGERSPEPVLRWMRAIEATGETHHDSTPVGAEGVETGGAGAAASRWLMATGRTGQTGGSLIEQESVLSGTADQVADGILRMTEVALSLPENSGLVARLSGDNVQIEPKADGARVLMVNAEIRIADPEGVDRVIVSAEQGATLVMVTKEESGEYNMYVHATRGEVSAQLIVRCDTTTGKPEGEGDQPIGSVRWELIGPGENRENPWRLKIRWNHDLSSVGADAAPVLQERRTDAIDVQLPGWRLGTHIDRPPVVIEFPPIEWQILPQPIRIPDPRPQPPSER